MFHGLIKGTAAYLAVRFLGHKRILSKKIGSDLD
jgi:hypothetical protein